MVDIESATLRLREEEKRRGRKIDRNHRAKI